MKITKAELKRIIKEELEEASFMGKVKKGLGMQNYADSDAAALDAMVDELSKAGDKMDQMSAQLVKMNPALKDVVLKTSNGIRQIVQAVIDGLEGKQ